jgi:hypothetical protein
MSPARGDGALPDLNCFPIYLLPDVNAENVEAITSASTMDSFGKER